MTEPHNINRSFADNVNYLSELDKQYCKSGYIVRNGIQLGTQEYFGKATINVFSTELKQHILTDLYSGSIVGNNGLEQFIGLVCSAIESLYPDIEVSYSITDSTSAIVDKNLEIVFNSTDTIVGLITIDISLVINGSVAAYTKYSITSDSDNYISVLPYLAMLDDDFNNSIFNIGKYSEEIKNVNDNISSVNTVSDSISNVNLVAPVVDNVSIIASNIDAVVTVGDLDNIEDIKRVALDLNSIDDNMRADITIVANDLYLGVNSNIAKVSVDILDVVNVSSSIEDVIKVSDDIENVISVSENIDSVVVNSNNIASINANASNIIAIQNAEANANIATSGASIATTKSNEASVSALSANNAAAIATTKANEASISASDSSASANSAATSATISSAKADEASISASSASSSASIATEQAIISTTNATNSTVKASEALASATQAYSSASISTNAAANALISETNSEASMEKAEKWAEEPEDVEVESGRYSAKHWALKAKEFSTGAASNISYDGSISGLSSSNVESAIDELDNSIDLLSSNKVDKIIGKGLSTEDYTTGEKSKLLGIEANANNYVKPSSEPISYIAGLQSALDSKATVSELNNEKARIDAILSASSADKDSFAEIVTLINTVDIENDTTFAGYVASNNTRSTNIENTLSTKVGKIVGKQLSTEDYTTAEKTKLSGIATGANNYTHPTSGVVAGTYKSVTVDANGHITSGTNPTTVSGYGLTDVYTKTEIQTVLPKVGLDITNVTAPGIGQIAWNKDEGTADLGLGGGSVLQIGQENTRRVLNSTGSIIPNGTLCMYDGTVGNSGKIKVKPFTGGYLEYKYVYGLATQDIPVGNEYGGLITIDGKVRGINTSGSQYGEVWNNEDILYAKPNDSGKLTNIEPADNELKMIVASVISAHSTNGILEIRIFPFNENLYYTKQQNDILLNDKLSLTQDFILDLGSI